MIELTINKEDINRLQILLKDLDPKIQGGAIHKGLLKASSTILRQLVSNISGIILKRRTGNLAKSMGFRIYNGENGALESQIGSGATLQTNRMIYANILETGGVIRPVTAKMLAIPIGEALTPAGVARFKPRQIVSEGGYDNSFFRRTKAGNLILFGSKGGMAKISITPLFLMKDSVTIPPFRYMETTVEQTQGQVVLDIISKIKEAKEKL
jgi:hypothetical protein